MNLQNQIDYLKLNDLGDLFEGCSVPDPLEMDRVRGAIVMRCGLLMPLFSEPETQKAATQQFFYENQWNFAHIINVIKAEYSPIENVAEIREEITENNSRDTLTINRNGTEAHSGTDGRTIQESGQTADTESGGDTTTNEISAENATSYQADNKSTVQHNGTTTTTHGKKTQDDLTHGKTITSSGSDKHTSDKDGTTKYTVNRHGNIGVTTNQDMINQELDLLHRFNPYRFIADLYEKEMMIGLY